MLKVCEEYLTSSNNQAQPKEPLSLIDSIKQANVVEVKKSRSGKSDTVPIIIVPAAPTSMVNMYNIRDFLTGSSYVPPTEAKQNAKGVKESTITIEHSSGSSKAKSAFQIVDNPTRLSIEDWNRVKAVFVQGPAWQFKGWKWENPVDLFQNGIYTRLSTSIICLVCGYYVHYEDTAVEPQVASWNVHKLTISRSKRHLDAPAVMKFWELLDKFIDNN